MDAVDPVPIDSDVITRKASDMKTVSLATAMAVVLATAINIAQAAADGPRASSSNAIVGAADSNSPSRVAAASHYQWQYHYVGRHPRWEGYWALVK